MNGPVGHDVLLGNKQLSPKTACNGVTESATVSCVQLGGIQTPEAGEQKNEELLGLKEHPGTEQPLCLYRKSRTLWGWLQGKN